MYNAARWLLLVAVTLGSGLARARWRAARWDRRVDAPHPALPSSGTAEEHDPRPRVPPARRERERILLDLMPSGAAAGDLDLPLLARLTPGYDVATLERFTQQLCATAAAEGRQPTMSDAAQVLERLAGVERQRPRLLEPDERVRAATMAAGHVMLAWQYGLINPGTSVSILTDDPAWSLIGGLAAGERQLAALDVLLAGPVAHELLNGARERALEDRTILYALVLAVEIARGRQRRFGALGERLTYSRLPVDWRALLGSDGVPHVTTLEHKVRLFLDGRKAEIRSRLESGLPRIHRLAIRLADEETVGFETIAALFQSPVENEGRTAEAAEAYAF